MFILPKLREKKEKKTLIVYSFKCINGFHLKGKSPHRDVATVKDKL